MNGTEHRTSVAVPNGTAEQLARLSHFAGLQTVQAEEMDAVAFFLLGDVGDAESRADLWDSLRDDCDLLWHLITADWCENDLDELTEDDWAKYSFANVDQELDVRRSLTADRLVLQIEASISVCRIATAEARRAQRAVA